MRVLRYKMQVYLRGLTIIPTMPIRNAIAANTIPTFALHLKGQYTQTAYTMTAQTAEPITAHKFFIMCTPFTSFHANHTHQNVRKLFLI